MSEVVVTSQTNLRNEVSYGDGHSFITDEPIGAGGEEAGPDPYTLLLAALGSCISMRSESSGHSRASPFDCDKIVFTAKTVSNACRTRKVIFIVSSVRSHLLVTSLTSSARVFRRLRTSARSTRRSLRRL